MASQSVFDTLSDRKFLRTLGLGQLISALIAGTGVCSTYLVVAGINVPTTQSFLNYLLLMVYAGWRLCKEGTKPLKVSPARYALLALADVEANALIVAAYQHTTITSIMLLDCATIPVCMALSWKFLGVRFNRQHYIGVAICLLGLIILAISDASTNNSSAPGNALLGDALCLGAATLYAISNVGQEACLQNGRGARIEFLGAMGVFGSLICGIQAALLESSDFKAIVWTDASKAAFAGFALCLFAMYSLTSVFLSQDGGAGSSGISGSSSSAAGGGLASLDSVPSAGGHMEGQGGIMATTGTAGLATTQVDDWGTESLQSAAYANEGGPTLSSPASSSTPSDSRSTLFNLSLLTSDVWAILAATLLFGQDLSAWYFLALVVVVAGLVVYHRANRVS